MEKLNFVLPEEFVRLSWASRQAEQTWSPIIAELSNFFLKLERLALGNGYKPAVIQEVKPEDLVAFCASWSDKTVIPLSRIPITQGYQSSSRELKGSEPWQYRVVIGSQKIAEAIAVASVDNDLDTIGKHLGYPTCCRKFFQQWWVEKGWIDTTYPMSQGWEWGYIEPVNNILLRHIGIRAVSHLPCSFECVKTKYIGEANLKLAHGLGFEREVGLLKEMLGWPISWSSLHGIAITTTPYLKITTRTDALPEKVTIVSKGLPFTPLSIPVLEDTWTANGFKSLKGMDDAHGFILNSVVPLRPNSVIDFGCGNSRLLHKMETLLKAETLGVDTDAAKEPDIVCNIFDFKFDLTSRFDLALISWNRIDEQPARWPTLLDEIKKHCKYLCCYSYDDNSRTTITRLSHGQVTI